MIGAVSLPINSTLGFVLGLRIRLEPPFRPLAGQPRFVALLQRLHLAAVPSDAVTQLSDAAIQHA